MNAQTFCFFCSLLPADRTVKHSIFGERPSCADCDPIVITHQSRDMALRMSGTIVGSVQAGLADLGDARTIDHCLRGAGYTDDAIALHAELATERARRVLQEPRSGFRRAANVACEAAAFLFMVGGLIGLYAVLNPPAPSHAIHVAEAAR